MQTIIINPWACSHPFDNGISNAGTERRKVMKMMTAFPIRAIPPVSVAHSISRSTQT